MGQTATNIGRKKRRSSGQAAAAAVKQAQAARRKPAKGSAVKQPATVRRKSDLAATARKRSGRSKAPVRRKQSARASKPAGTAPPRRTYARTLRELQAIYAADPLSLTPAELNQLHQVQRLTQDAPQGETVDVNTAATLLGCSVRNVRALVTDGKIVAVKRGRYSVESICTHLREYQDRRLKERQWADGEPPQGTLEWYELKLAEVNVELKHLRLERETDKLVDIHAVNEQMAAIAARLRGMLDHVIRRFGGDVAEAIMEIMDDLEREFLK